MAEQARVGAIVVARVSADGARRFVFMKSGEVENPGVVTATPKSVTDLGEQTDFSTTFEKERDQHK